MVFAHFAPMPPPMPPRAPLDMPPQSLKAYDKHLKHRRSGRQPLAGLLLARLVLFGVGLGLSAYGIHEMYGVIFVGTITSLQWLLLVLFAINFTWISLAFASAAVGLFAPIFGRISNPGKAEAEVDATGRTAIVLPAYNEDPVRVFGALTAMMEDMSRLDQCDRFDWFVLSDTTNPDIWVAEEHTFIETRKRFADAARLYYRHRPKNTERKAGNIQDFVSGWGARYAYMVILDADSLMEARTIVALAQAMDADPDAGIVQSVPLIINRNTLFARLQQFAARVYGPVLAAGLSSWAGRDGNYWGHNAIVRVQAFADSCRLPHLKGKPPFGGHILSHDFVEAALIRRAGYSVYLLPHLGGSYEESPPSLIDLAIRDRRWCLGNLQHTRILNARGLHWMSRFHLANGVMSYLASPIWLMQLLVGIVIVLQSHYVRPEYFTDEFALMPTWPQFDAERALWLFLLTMVILLLPKVYGYLVMAADARTRRASGGFVVLTASTLVEIILTALLAPIMMLLQTGAVIRILLGADSGWTPQRRDDGTPSFRYTFRRHLSHSALGFIALISGLLIAPSLAFWMLPTIAGLILASALSWWTGLLSAGLQFKRFGLLITPEETTPPRLIERSRHFALLLDQATNAEKPSEPGLLRITRVDGLHDLHDSFLSQSPLRQRGDVDVAYAVAAVKVEEAATLEEFVGWLTPAEHYAVLGSDVLLAKATRLKSRT